MSETSLEQSIQNMLTGTVVRSALPIYLMEDCAKVSVNGCDKFISLSDLLAILEKSMGEELQRTVSGLSLPSNTFFIAQSASKLQINCYYVGGVRKVIYNNRAFDMVVPNIVISHVLSRRDSDYVIDSTKYLCTDLSVGQLPREFISGINHANRVFLLPFTNIYEGGNMCYGGNQVPNRFVGGNLRGLDWYFQVLFESSFNDDLGVNAISRRLYPQDWYTKLTALATEGKPFPYDLLDGYVAP